MDLSNKTFETIECDIGYEKSDEDQFWLFARAFDKDDDDLMQIGFDKGKSRIVEYDATYPFWYQTS